MCVLVCNKRGILRYHNTEIYNYNNIIRAVENCNNNYNLNKSKEKD